MSAKAIPPGSWLGLLGGGQLGRMFCMAAQSLGYKVCVLDPGSDSPAGAANAGLFAVAIIAGTDPAVAKKLAAFRLKQTNTARAMRVPPDGVKPA